MERDDEIRVLRLIEYRYKTVEDMEADMARWTQQSPPGWRGGRFTSAHLPPQVVRGLFSATNDPQAPTGGPRPDGEAETIHEFTHREE